MSRLVGHSPFNAEFALLRHCPLEGYRKLVRLGRELTASDYCRLDVFVPGTSTVVSFEEQGGVTVKALTRQSCAATWNAHPDKSPHFFVNDARFINFPLPDECRMFKQCASFLSWGMRTTASNGGIWGTLTFANHFPNLFSYDKLVLCSQLIDAFLENTRTTFLTKVAQAVFHLQATESVAEFCTILHRFYMEHAQLVSVSLAVLNEKRDKAALFIDQGMQGNGPVFKEASFDVTDNTLAGQLKASGNDHQTVKVPAVWATGQQGDPRRGMPSEIKKLLPNNHGGSAFFYGLPLAGPSTGGPMILGLSGAFAGQRSGFTGVVYLQAMNGRGLREVGAQLLLVSPIFASLLDKRFAETVDRVISDWNGLTPTRQRTIDEMATISQIRRILNDYKSNRCTETSELQKLTLDGLMSTESSSGVVMKAKFVEEKVAAKAIPIKQRAFRAPRIRMELAILSVVLHSNIVRSWQTFINVAGSQIIDRCPPCSCASGSICQRERITGALVQKVFPTDLRVSPWDLVIMELCDGTLHAEIHERGLFRDLSNQSVFKGLVLTLIEMAEAVAYLHVNGIVHGDFKPENILVQRQPPSALDARGFIVKLADFGTSRVIGAEQCPPCACTMAYKAPEYMLGRDKICKPSHEDQCAGDVYSFGVTVWEMVEARVPFQGHTQFSLQNVVAVEHYRPELTADWPGPCRDLLNRCWHQHPQERPPFREIVSILRSMLE